MTFSADRCYKCMERQNESRDLNSNYMLTLFRVCNARGDDAG